MPYSLKMSSSKPLIWQLETMVNEVKQSKVVPSRQGIPEEMTKLIAYNY